MAQLSAKLRSTAYGPAHWCPGCRSMHIFYVEKPAPGGARWTWNGDISWPTFEPSMIVTCDGMPDEGWPAERCHYFLRAGRIQFLGDSTHEFSGQNVRLPDLPAPAVSVHDR